ncbi:MAG TPA: response regulator [Fimbriimonadaceae bacterium]|nr:response regulator [Fimbriimonadaceae bacterium]
MPENSETRILVVDDERPIVQLLRLSLERQGYRVLTAFDGREALDVLDREAVDLMVLDWMMPYVDGLEVLQTVRRDPALAHLKIIMLSTLTQDEDIARGTQEGADRYLAKPFDPKELYRVIRDL